MIIKDLARSILTLYRIERRNKATTNLDKPKVINLLANDICNSKCTMCYIWKQKRDVELSPAELEEVLSDSLFTEVTHVGITGGEPTLRKDLTGLYQACINALPNLKGLSIITNAIQKKHALDRIKSVYELCKSYEVDFSAMVSLDGLEEVHDHVRGRKGNFKSAIEVIEGLKEILGPPKVSIGCTITKDNVWNMHPMLDYLEANRIYGRFRIAEYINRLYNENIEDKIRIFNEVEIYELTTFFIRLQESFEHNPTYKRTYDNLIHMLNWGKRKIGCPYQSQGIVIDCRANVQYCAPKSKQIGNALEKSAHSIWNNNKKEKERIKQEDCDDCIHDYHAAITQVEYIDQEKISFWKRIFCIEGYKYHNGKVTPLLKLIASIKLKKQIFITGWYGTETVGDKAILGGILKKVMVEYPERKIVISTLTRKEIVRKTLDELDVKATIVNAYSKDFVEASFSSEVVIMGGGPLMDIGTMWVPLWAFHLAKSMNRKTIIWGCGLGPLRRNICIYATKELLAKSDEIYLRDTKSHELAMELLPSIQATVINDPSIDYLKEFRFSLKPNSKNQIACFLREWPREYSKALTDEEYKRKKEKIEATISENIRIKVKETGASVRLYPMHSLEIGGDDRKFARYFIKRYLSDIEADYHKESASVQDICQAITEAKFNICMRFHSVVFASTLNTRFLALDYTFGGKIYGHLKDKDELHRYVNLEGAKH